MKQYRQIDANTVSLLGGPGSHCIPVSTDNTDYAAMLSEIKAGTAELLPELPVVVHWKDQRQASIADGGYGTIREQLEMLGEGDASIIASYQTHIAAVKVRFPKA